MATLLSELTRVLARSMAAEARTRADTPLNRAEMMAFATVTDLAARFLAVETPAAPSADAGWDEHQAHAAFDVLTLATD